MQTYNCILFLIYANKYINNWLSINYDTKLNNYVQTIADTSNYEYGMGLISNSLDFNDLQKNLI